MHRVPPWRGPVPTELPLPPRRCMERLPDPLLSVASIAEVPSSPSSRRIGDGNGRRAHSSTVDVVSVRRASRSRMGTGPFVRPTDNVTPSGHSVRRPASIEALSAINRADLLMMYCESSCSSRRSHEIPSARPWLSCTSLALLTKRRKPCVHFVDSPSCWPVSSRASGSSSAGAGFIPSAGSRRSRSTA